MSETGLQQEEDELQPEVEIDRELDRELENKSRQHNLTSANVRSIIHVSVKLFISILFYFFFMEIYDLTSSPPQEVITNEHVVAMMKAAINETEPVPVFVSICCSGTVSMLYTGLGLDLTTARVCSFA